MKSERNLEIIYMYVNIEKISINSYKKRKSKKKNYIKHEKLLKMTPIYAKDTVKSKLYKT